MEFTFSIAYVSSVIILVLLKVLFSPPLTLFQIMIIWMCFFLMFLAKKALAFLLTTDLVKLNLLFTF